MVNIPTIELNNGLKMPGLAFGTYACNEETGKQAIKDAIQAGYRHIDGAYLYLNESIVGEAINETITDGTVKREDLFIVSKLWTIFHDRVEEACRKSLAACNLDYFDLYLIHTPICYRYVNDLEFCPMKDNGEIDTLPIDHLDIWRQMENLVEKGLVKSIGVSNFSCKQIKRIVDNCKIKPVCNQVECSPIANQLKLIEFCKPLRVVVTGYSPFGQRPNEIKKTPKYLFDETVAGIAKKYGKTSAQVVLRYCIQMGAIPIVKSSTKTRIHENMEVFDFELSQDEFEYLKIFESFQDRLLTFDEYKNDANYPNFP
jgi:aldehyde reductase